MKASSGAKTYKHITAKQGETFEKLVSFDLKTSLLGGDVFCIQKKNSNQNYLNQNGDVELFLIDEPMISRRIDLY